ncbi:BamA/TamA family outer membrane protein, partial [candidate division KSB1 bacterium]|nr:BamA/TamA family outer membrane protein [candidate division KSB1 bacterium]
SSGSFMEQKIEFAGGFLKGAHSFVKFTSENRFFQKVSPESRVVFAERFYFGWMDRFGESLIIPLNERFYAGGDGSIRGFSRRSVGPKRDGDQPIGGNFTIVTNYEIRFPLYKKLGATLFWDAGNVWQNARRFNFEDIRYGTGCGLRYNSPLGIARLDFGVNLDRKSSEKAGEIYFTIGQLF